MFRDDFVWGVASSAYQVEGTDPEDGRGKCVWDVFTEEGHIHENQNAYTACDHMHRYKEDYALMRQLGIKAYRFSMNWARILPEGTGRVNEYDCHNEGERNHAIHYHVSLGASAGTSGKGWLAQSSDCGLVW